MAVAEIQHVVIVAVPANAANTAHHHADVRFFLATDQPELARPEGPAAPLAWLSPADAVARTAEANVKDDSPSGAGHRRHPSSSVTARRAESMIVACPRAKEDPVMEFIRADRDAHLEGRRALQALEAEWERATEGKRTLRRSIVTVTATTERYVVLAFFDSYESAMVNSNLAETADFGQKQAALMDVPPVFHDLDVIEDRS